MCTSRFTIFPIFHEIMCWISSAHAVNIIILRELDSLLFRRFENSKNWYEDELSPTLFSYLFAMWPVEAYTSCTREAAMKIIKLRIKFLLFFSCYWYVICLLYGIAPSDVNVNNYFQLVRIKFDDFCAAASVAVETGKRINDHFLPRINGISLEMHNELKTSCVVPGLYIASVDRCMVTM